MSETQLLDLIIGRKGLAWVLGWRVTHSRPAMIKDPASVDGYSWRTAIQGETGFPDLVLAKAPRLILAELKGENGKLTPEQEAWLDCLAANEGVEVYLWYPSDWLSGEIESILTLSHTPNRIEKLEYKSAWWLNK